MMTEERREQFEKLFDNDESLDIFLRNMAKFDKYFCQVMTDGVDFTLRMEVHGNKGKLIHCRVQNDGFDRPKENYDFHTKNGRK